MQLAIGCGLAFVPYRVFVGFTHRTWFNGVLTSYSAFNVLGLVAGIAAVGVAVRLALRYHSDEKMTTWRLAAVALVLAGTLQVLHATEILTLISPCTSPSPATSWCRYER